MSPEQLSDEQNALYENTKRMAQNISKLLAQEGETVIINGPNGGGNQTKKNGD